MTTKNLSFADAIRKGAAMSEPSRGSTLGSHGETCAIGAALLAINANKGQYSDAFQFFDICGAMREHPVTGNILCVITIVRELNDYHCWTRERIAAWVDTIEPKQN